MAKEYLQISAPGGGKMPPFPSWQVEMVCDEMETCQLRKYHPNKCRFAMTTAALSAAGLDEHRVQVAISSFNFNFSDKPFKRIHNAGTVDMKEARMLCRAAAKLAGE